MVGGTKIKYQSVRGGPEGLYTAGRTSLRRAGEDPPLWGIIFGSGKNREQIECWRRIN